MNVGISRPLRELHLFAGAGGGILGSLLLGHRTVCAVEIEPYRRKVLLQRQRDGILPWFPIWDDITTFDGKLWRGRVDIVSGGFPCQGISSAGKGLGIDDPRSGLWSHQFRVIREVGPRIVWVENSPMLTVRGLGTVLGDLASLGYDAVWGVVSCADAAWIDGTPIADHERERIWILAVSDSKKERRSEAWGFRCFESQKWVGGIREEIPHSDEIGRKQMEPSHTRGEERAQSDSKIAERPSLRAGGKGWWSSEPGVYGVADGVADRVDRLEAIGDGQVPAVVALAWRTLMGER